MKKIKLNGTLWYLCALLDPPRLLGHLLIYPQDKEMIIIMYTRNDQLLYIMVEEINYMQMIERKKKASRENFILPLIIFFHEIITPLISMSMRYRMERQNK